LNGSIDATGGSNAFARGFEYGLTTSYGTLASTSGSFGTGSFTANLTDIACNTTYHFRAYAQNSSGAASSSDQTFTTANSDSACGKVTYTYDDSGIQTLRYNGQTYIDTSIVPYTSSNLLPEVMFHGGGVDKPYGFLTGSTDALPVSAAVRSTGTGPDFVNHIYRNGQADSLTLKTTYSTPDTQTFKIDFDITNNDSTDSVTLLTTEYFMWLVTPGPLTQEMPYLGANLAVGGIGEARPTSFLKGTWGSIVLYSDDYSKKWAFGSATNNYPAQNGKNYFLLDLKNNSTSGTSSNMLSEPILPGQTAHYSIYIKFGTPANTSYELAPSAYTAFRTAFPSLVNWSDRAPLALWFIGNGVPSATNPRSYLWDSNLDVSNQSNFNTQLLNTTDSIINRLNGMNPRPQGVMIWDLEGDEFYHYFTYVGYPNKLADLAPEMDAIVDTMMSRLTTAGYKVGLTLRPGDFQTGPISALPATCYHDPNGNRDLDDVYIATDGTYPRRGYSCTATNTWTNSADRLPSHQHSPQDDPTLLGNLESKVNYAKNRWGVKMFYVDSTVYSSNGGGGSIEFRLFRQLQQDFPDCIFFPENEYTPYWGSSAPYNQTNPAVGGGIWDTSQETRNIYPTAFSALANFDGIDFNDSTTRSAFVQSVKNGNIYLIDGWWDNPTAASILGIYNEAGYSPTPSASITSHSNGSSVSGSSVSITASASTYLNTGIAGVQFKIDGTNIGQEVTTAPYTVSWNSSSVGNGSHTITAVARDAIGNSTTTPAVTITVSNSSSGSGGGGGGGYSSGPSTYFINPLFATPGMATTSTSTIQNLINPPCKTWSYPSLSRNMSQGVSGNDVYNLKKILYIENLLSTTSPATLYDATTTRAVSLYQAKYKIVYSGTPSTTGFGNIGPKTRAFINNQIVQAKYPSLRQCLTFGTVTSPAIPVISGTSTYTFVRQLKTGSVGNDVRVLQVFLNTHGFIISKTGNGSPGHETTYFGPATATALAKFQEYYAKEVLAPYNLTQGTGFFGAATMRKVNGMR
jgi:hypothetical protein